ncbi:MAG: hypothetical protein KJZ78_15395, partial [Bryobacteraceae bacterium]|nr:hypothetical protein [Bryobacteraceae bacterium]
MRAHWPDKDGAILHEFMQSVDAPSKRSKYAAALSDFQSFVSKRPLNQGTLRAWLQACAVKHPIY